MNNPPKNSLTAQIDTRSYLRIRIFVLYRGGSKFQPTGILLYFEELKRGPDKEIGQKDFFEMASILYSAGMEDKEGKALPGRRLQNKYIPVASR